MTQKFERVLVANRGEIACRVIRTLHKMGIDTVAVYHHEDRTSPYVNLAKEAVEITANNATAAYLDIEQILQVAENFSVEAIHPGYGFLSENPRFASAVAERGLIFIGPQANVIALMGDKIKSRRFAEQHGIPVAPSVILEGSEKDFVKYASEVGFPLLIKAAGGGGGKGMRVAESEEHLLPAIESARGEALRYFSDDRIYLEKFIEKPRHIEVQILGDGKGEAVHLFERECSIQRRFQKVIEESPAPKLSPQVRDAMCKAAVQLARKARYLNAGTVEFILDSQEQFYFLEMNTRLQVEHPVTELVCQVDLVEAQIEIATNNKLPLKQSDIKQVGHAIECRVCCERPELNFQPATGVIRSLSFPSRPFSRLDNGVAQGQMISASFDSMIAKLICFGENRASAIAETAIALEELVILGVEHNIAFLHKLIRHPAFASGELHNGFIEEHADSLQHPPLTDTDKAALVIAAALEISQTRRLAYGVPEPYASIGNWSN